MPDNPRERFLFSDNVLDMMAAQAENVYRNTDAPTELKILYFNLSLVALKILVYQMENEKTLYRP